MQRSVFDITLTIASPFLFPGLAAGAAGVDVACLRNEAGQALLPGDQLRGVLKAALVQLACLPGGKVVTATQIAQWFGERSKPAAGSGQMNEPERGTLVFGDLVADRRDSSETVRIAIDDELGAVKRGSLQVIELAAPFRQPVEFSGQIIAFHGEGEGKHLADALRKALAMTPAIGAVKSPGFGEILNDKSGIAARPPVSLKVPAASHAPGLGRVCYRVTFDRPVLVDAEKIAANVFKGAAIVPGGVFKGALARRLVLAGENPESGMYATALSALSFGPAFPGDKDGTTGRALPLSLVAVKKGGDIKAGDALHVPPGRGVLLHNEVAKFQTDWKDGYEDAAVAAAGITRRAEPALLPRTHTAIKDGIASEGQIFTAIARSHVFDQAPYPQRCWHLTVDYSGVDAAHAVLFDRLLLDGLDFIGKTSALARFTRDDTAALPAVKALANSGGKLFAVVLETAAVLHDPAEMQSPWDAYEAYWEEKGVELVNFFATQRLAGGYLATRYRAYGTGYYPFVLTNPGSVFLLKGDGLEAKLEKWILSGLPVPKLDDKQPVWTTCPYLPENGYGRFSADYLNEASVQDGLIREIAGV